MVLGEKMEHLSHRVHRLAKLVPQRGAFGNLGLNQLSESLLENTDPRNEATPRSLEAACLHDSGRWVQTLGLDPRPTVEIGFQLFDTNRPVGQSMGRQD